MNQPTNDNKNDELNLENKWKNATIANNFIFYKVMRHHQDACKRLLEMLLQIKIESITMNTEETIALDFDSKSIRLDVFVNTKEEAIKLGRKKAKVYLLDDIKENLYNEDAENLGKEDKNGTETTN